MTDSPLTTKALLDVLGIEDPDGKLAELLDQNYANHRALHAAEEEMIARSAEAARRHWLESPDLAPQGTALPGQPAHRGIAPLPDLDPA